MAATVSVPIRLRIDAEAARAQLDALDDALQAAAGRALARSSEAVLKPRGGYCRTVLHRPRFAWSGAGLPELDAPARARLEQRISDTLAELAHEAGIAVPAERDLPLSDPPVERVDPERLTYGVTSYDVPSYQQQGHTRTVPVHRAPAHAAPATGVVWAPVARQRLFSDRAYLAQQRDASLRHYGRRPHATYIGVIWKEGAHLDLWFGLEAGGGHDFRIQFTPTKGRKMGADGHWQDPQSTLPDPDFATLTILGPAGTREERIATIRLSQSEEIRFQLEQRHKARTMRQSEFDEQVEHETQREIETRADALPSDTAFLARLTVGADSFDVPVPRSFTVWQGSVELLPLVAPGSARRRRTGGGRGQGAGGQDGQPGAGQAGQTGGGQGGQPGQQDGGDGPGEGEGGFIDTGDEGQEGATAYFPSLPGEATTPGCEAFLGEASLEELGAEGKPLEDLMHRIEHDLQLPHCNYPAFFCLTAAEALEGRAAAVGAFAAGETHEAFTSGVTHGQANLGFVEFRPVVSPAIQFMRHLASVVPEIDEVARQIRELYFRRPDLIKGMYHGDGAGFALHLLIELTDRTRSSIARLFGETCRILLLQLLRSSRSAILARYVDVPRYASDFRQVIYPQLQRVNELLQLRDRLKARITFETNPMLYAQQATPMQVHNASDADFVKENGRTVRIRDSRGRSWTVDELENAITLRRGVTEEIDPLVKQISDLPEQMAKFAASSSGLVDELADMLEEMLGHNSDITDETADDWKYGFRASRISEDLPGNTIPGGRYPLHGIHLQAHEQIGEFFEGSQLYPMAIDALFSGELGAHELTSFLTFVGLVFLSVVCPPAAFVLGATLAVVQYAEAKDREALYGALMDPEEILSRAEVEAELFAAKLGLALAFIPDATAICRGGLVGARVALEEGVIAGARTVFGLVREEAMRAMAAALERGLIQAFVTECVKAELINLVIENVLGPVIEQVSAEVEATGPVGGMQGVMSRLAQRTGGTPR